MKRPVKIEFSDQELNYIQNALRADVKRMEADPFFQSGMGNGRYLYRYQHRLERRISRLHSESYRKRMGEKKWKKSRQFINKIIRDAKKPIAGD